MPRFAYLAVVFGVLVAAACSKVDTLCANLADPNCKLPPDAMPDAPPPCGEDVDCKVAGALTCNTSSGECVECVAPGQTDACLGTKPVCNNQFACEACNAASDCPGSDICLPSGACVAETDVAYVVAGGTDAPMCTKAAPCSKIQTGLAAVNGGTPRAYLKIKGGFDEGVVIARNVTILADPGTRLTRSSNGAILTVNSGVVEISDLEIDVSKSGTDPGIVTAGTSELTLKRVTVSENKGNGITCQGQLLTVSASKILDNEGTGIACTAGRLIVSSSTIARNRAGGITALGGSFDITNNFVFENGDTSSANVGGVNLDPLLGTTNRFEFNTVVDNHIRSNAASLAGGVVCDIEGFVAANNIIASNDVASDEEAAKANLVMGGRCSFATSTVTGVASDIVALKFVQSNTDPRDYHLQAGSTAIGTATTSSTVTVDFDGDARPQGTGADRGADEFKAP